MEFPSIPALPTLAPLQPSGGRVRAEGPSLRTRKKTAARVPNNRPPKYMRMEATLGIFVVVHTARPARLTPKGGLASMPTARHKRRASFSDGGEKAKALCAMVHRFLRGLGR